MNIDIDDELMAQAQKAAGRATKKQTVEEALRLLISLKRQREVDAAFGKFPWRGAVDCRRHQRLDPLSRRPQSAHVSRWRGALGLDEIIVGDLMLCELLQSLHDERAARHVEALPRRTAALFFFRESDPPS